MGTVRHSYYLFFFDIVRFMESDVNFNNKQSIENKTVLLKVYTITFEKFRIFLKSDSFCHAGLDPASNSCLSKILILLRFRPFRCLSF